MDEIELPEGKTVQAWLAEIAEGYAATDSNVNRLLGRLQWIGRAMLVLMVAGLLLSAYFYDQNRQRIKANTTAIEVSCTLLVDVATQSGVTGPGQASDAAKVQDKITALAFDVIIRGMTMAERERFAKLIREREKAGAFVALPRCEQVAREPGSVVTGKTKTKTAPPKTTTTPPR